MKKIIECQSISKYFGQEPCLNRALFEVSFSIDQGESVAITGPSGCGKTTLLNVLSLLIRPDSGSFFYDDIDMIRSSERQQSDFRNREIGFVVQDFALIENESALENVQLPLLYTKERLSRSQKRKLALESLNRVDMHAQSRQPVHTLSGGQRQRVAIARALINNPSIILADEPTGALDTQNQEQVMRLLMNLVHEGKTLIMATHNLDLAARCSRVIKILDGQIIESSHAGRIDMHREDIL